MRYILLAAAMLPLGLSHAAHAQTITPAEPSVPVTVVVDVPTPATAPRSVIENGMRASIPQYRAVPGLVRKYFTIGEGTFGGVYLFASRAAADAWFSPAWQQRVVATYGKPATVTFYEVPVLLDNAEVPTSAVASE